MPHCELIQGPPQAFTMNCVLTDTPALQGYPPGAAFQPPAVVTLVTNPYPKNNCYKTARVSYLEHMGAEF